MTQKRTTKRSSDLNHPKVIDLFAGAGGLSLGAARAGFDVSCAVEIDKHAILTHSTNFPHSLHLALDIATLNGDNLLQHANLSRGEVTGIIGGPPCQGFSTIGRRCPKDIRNDLFTCFFRLVNEIQPSFFLAENVPGILETQFDPIRQTAFSYIEKDYELLPPFTISANEYGAATSRTRIFFFGYNPKRFKKNLTIEDFYSLKLIPENQVLVRRALSGLPLNLATPTRGKLNFSKLAKIPTSSSSAFENLMFGQIPKKVGFPQAVEKLLEKGEISGCISTNHTPEVVKRFAALRPGETDPISRCQKLNPDGFCPTLRAGTGPDKGSFQAVRPIHFSEPRVITPREAARLQGFPDWFVFHETKWHSFRQIGNSVSPIVAETILQKIYQYII